jgi:hypothetical protein
MTASIQKFVLRDRVEGALGTVMDFGLLIRHPELFHDMTRSKITGVCNCDDPIETRVIESVIHPDRAASVPIPLPQNSLIML